MKIGILIAVLIYEVAVIFGVGLLSFQENGTRMKPTDLPWAEEIWVWPHYRLQSH